MQLGNEVTHEFNEHLHGIIIGLREGRIQVLWQMSRLVSRLIKNGEDDYKTVIVVEPFKLTYWHPSKFIKENENEKQLSSGSRYDRSGHSIPRVHGRETGGQI